jgi:hypothetical protein
VLTQECGKRGILAQSECACGGMAHACGGMAHACGGMAHACGGIRRLGRIQETLAAQRQAKGGHQARTCWQQGRSALDFLSQLLRGTLEALPLPP